jgi:hypothetical protein
MPPDDGETLPVVQELAQQQVEGKEEGRQKEGERTAVLIVLVIVFVFFVVL